ncbi:MAG: ornithine carbamoyltransferase, partial [Pseudohongiellaceae bacterium]
QAVAGASLVSTHVWASMGQEAEQQKRLLDFANFEVTTELMSYASNDAIFLHCLPAHRGEEVSAEVIDSPDSLVWEQAENRLHAQKALLEFLLCS